MVDEKQKPLGRIEEQLDIQGGIIDNFVRQLFLLEEKLEPVLSFQEEERSASSPSVEEVFSPLEKILTINNNRLNGQLKRISILLNRLDI